MSTPTKPANGAVANTTSRRDFLKVGGAAVGALIIGVPTALAAPMRRLDENGVVLDAAKNAVRDAANDAAASLAPNQLLRIDADGTVTITITRSEMGQGVRTSLPMILADELGASMASVRLVQAIPTTADGPFRNMSTGGSESVSSMYASMQRAGAAAREMLIAAAAAQWSLPASELRARDGFVVHVGSDRRLAFGALVAAASALPVPQQPAFRARDEWSIVGKSVRRLDGPDIVTGKAIYGIDVRVPGMLFAAVAMSPVQGGTLATSSRAAALAVNGVTHLVDVPSGIAVVATSTWAAMKGRSALAARWNDGQHATFDSARLRTTLRATTQKPGAINARDVGDAEATIAKATRDGANRRLEASYEFPFQSHATMEPQNCTAHVTADGCEVWIGTQSPNDVQQGIAQTLGLTPDQVKVNVTLLGGSFGRRITNENAADAALISRKVGAPVHLLWSRPDDFAHDPYQPMSQSHLAAALGANGLPTAWRHRVAAPAVTASFGGVAMEAEALGARDVPYAIPNIRVEYTHVPVPMPMGWWRAIQFVPNVFAREAFLDELAAAAKIDPLEYRLQLLNEHSQADFAAAPAPAGQPRRPIVNVDRLRAVLQMAATKSAWHVPLGKGRGRGIACLSYDDRSYVAQVAEVEVSKAGVVRVAKITTVLDAGLVINPLGIIGQVESGIVWALTAAFHGNMTFAKGRAARTSFGEYRLAGMRDMPVMETHLMPGNHPPSGAGEPPVPAVAPAIVNAIYAATGKRVRALPITPSSLL